MMLGGFLVAFVRACDDIVRPLAQGWSNLVLSENVTLLEQSSASGTLEAGGRARC